VRTITKKGTIGAGIALDGEKEFRQSITNINKDLKVLKSEVGLVSAEFGDNANSMQALTKRSDVLSKEFDTQKDKVEALRKALANSEQQYGENDNKTKEWQASLNKAETELVKLDRELQTNDKYLEEAKQSTDGVATSIDQYGRQVKQSTVETKSFSDELDDAKKETKDLSKELDTVKGGLSSFGKVAVGAVVGLGAALYGVTESTKEFRQDFSKLEQNARDVGTGIDGVSGELKKLDAITGETDANIEGLSNLMAAGFKGEGLTKAVEALSGAVIKFPDTMKIEGLSDGLQETLATGKAVGTFGEMLERLGYNLADFDKGLAACNGEAEKQAYILDVLASTGLADVNKQYRENNKELIANADAQYDMREAMSDIATAVAPSLNRAMQKVSDGVKDFSEGTLPVLVDGLEWVIDNSDLVIGGIVGIATGLAVFKAGGVIVAGIELTQAAMAAYAAETTIAAGATAALNVVQLASPMGLVAAAVGLAVGGLAIYALNADKSSSATDALNEKSKALTGTIKDNVQARKDSTKAVESEYGSISILTDELYKLADKTNKSNSEKAQMVSIVGQLNELMPELNLQIDKETGHLNKNHGEIEKVTRANLEYYKVKVSQEKLIGITEDMAKAEINLSEQMERKGEIQDKLNALSEKNFHLSSSQRKDYNDQMESLDEQIAKTKGTMKGLGAEFDSTSKYVGDNTDKLNANGAQYGELGSSAESASGQVTESVNTMSAETAEAVQSMSDSIYNSTGLFDEFSKSTDVSSETLMENLRSQVTGVAEWATNITELAKKGIDEGLLQELRDMGPEAYTEIAALNGMTGEQLTEYNRLWLEKTAQATAVAIEQAGLTKDGVTTETGQMSENGIAAAGGMAFGMLEKLQQGTPGVTGAADNMKIGVDGKLQPLAGIGLKTGMATATNLGSGISVNGYQASNAMGTVVGDAKTAGEKKSTGTTSIGKALVDGISLGIANNGFNVSGALGGIVSGAMKWVKDKYGIKSPSRVFRDEVGMMLGAGLAIGIENSAADVNRAMGVLNKEISLDPINASVNTSINGSSSTGGLDLGSLVSAITSLANRPITLSINGREFATATSGDMSIALNSLNKSGARQMGVVVR
jgi:methyl-accepting chemotaxis protein